MHGEHPSDVSLSISFGGTNIAVGLADKGAKRLLAKSGPLVWRGDPRWDTERALDSLIRLVVDECAGLLSQEMARPETVGVAWPGPGRYAEGMLAATFIPGCLNMTDLRSPLSDALTSAGWAAPRIAFGLGVSARAYGELYLPKGHFFAGNPSRSGIVLNMATGIAGAIVRNGEVVREHDAGGENYGQWGRFLFKDSQTRNWSWRPSADGRIGDHDPDREVRFTELCGGPAIFRRFVARMKEDASLQANFASALGTSLFKDVSALSVSRDTRLEKQVLAYVNQPAARGHRAVRDFVVEIAHDTAGALLCLRETFDRDFGDQVVLTGGVGSRFGDGTPDDLFLNELRSAFLKAGFDTAIVRTLVGLDAELLGCAFLL